MMAGTSKRVSIPEITPIRAQSRADQVAEQLLNAILAGTLKEGERLVEQKLASAFGVGQPTLREALKELEIQGFVRKIPQRGTYITTLSPEDVAQMHEVRMVLESLAVEKAAANAKEGDLKRLETRLEAMHQAARASDVAEYHRRDMEFHREIWRLCGNEHLLAALDRIAFPLFVFTVLRNLQNRELHTASLRQHRLILDGIASRDPQKARATFCEVTTDYWRKFGGIGA